MKQKLMNVLDHLIIFGKSKNKLGKIYHINLEKGNNRLSLFKFLKYSIIVFVVLIVLSYMGNFLYVLPVVFIFYLILVAGYAYTSIRLFLWGNRRPIELELMKMIVSNHFYEERNDKLLDSLNLAYMEDNDLVYVYAALDGGRYQRVATDLENNLQSALNLPLFEKRQELQVVMYVFRKKPIERITVDDSASTNENDMEVSIYDDIKINLNSAISMIISGNTGSGKSYTSYYWLYSLLQRNCDVRIFDFKQSDLFKLCELSDYPKDKYGSTIAAAFSLVKAIETELSERQRAYTGSNVFNRTLNEINPTEYRPVVLIIDEWASLILSMNKKEKTDFIEAISRIAMLGRSLNISVTIVTQRPSAETIDPTIRQNLVNKIWLGPLDNQTVQMMFNCGLNEMPEQTFEGKGTGYIYIDGLAIRPFQSPQFASPDIDKVLIPLMSKVSKLENSNKELLFNE